MTKVKHPSQHYTGYVETLIAFEFVEHLTNTQLKKNSSPTLEFWYQAILCF